MRGVDLSRRLESVEWAQLEHAHGDATDLPALLRQISFTEHPGEAFKALRDRLVHQGRVVYSAAVEIVPILVDMALDTRGFGRPAIVRLISDIAREAARVESTQPAKADWSRMWHGKLSLLEALLRDDDVEVRREASASMVSAESNQAHVLQLLLDVCAAEPDEPARLGQLTAVADLLPAVPEAMRKATAGRVAEIVYGGPVQLQMVGAFVRCQVERAAANLFRDALFASDVEQWRLTWCCRGRASIALWVDERLSVDRDLRRDLGRELLASANVATRVAGLRILMRVASKWRSAKVDIAVAGFRASGDTDETVSDLAVFLLAVSRSREREHADRLVVLAEERVGYQRAVAIWGLARMKDSRCVRYLVSSLQSEHLDYFHHPVFEGGPSRPTLPSIADVLLEATEWSSRLLPEVMRRLERVALNSERRELLRVVAAWGLSAEAALPVLVQGLTRSDPTLEIIALAAIGATASDVPSEVLRPAFERAATMPGVDRLECIRAYVRISADFGPVLAELADAGSGEPLSDSALYLVGVLGSAGLHYVSRIERQFSNLGRWATVGAARSHWEVTGEVEPAGRALSRFLADLKNGRPAVKADLIALRSIAEIGFTDSYLVGVLQFLVRHDERSTGLAIGWQQIDLDDALVETSRRILNVSETFPPE